MTIRQYIDSQPKRVREFLEVERIEGHLWAAVQYDPVTNDRILSITLVEETAS